MTYFDIHLVGLKNKSLVVSEKTTIDFIKRKLSKKTNILEIMYKGEILDDNMSLADYSIGDDCILYYHILDYLNEKKTKPATTNQLNTLDNLVNVLQNIMQIPIAVSNPNNVSATYEVELEQLENMGFMETNDREQVRSLLELYGGNVEAVANVLLGI